MLKMDNHTNNTIIIRHLPS